MRVYSAAYGLCPQIRNSISQPDRRIGIAESVEENAAEHVGDI